jgi:hypothetical protein
LRARPSKDLPCLPRRKPLLPARVRLTRRGETFRTARSCGVKALRPPSPGVRVPGDGKFLRQGTSQAAAAEGPDQGPPRFSSRAPKRAARRSTHKSHPSKPFRHQRTTLLPPRGSRHPALRCGETCWGEPRTTTGVHNGVPFLCARGQNLLKRCYFDPITPPPAHRNPSDRGHARTTAKHPPQRSAIGSATQRWAMRDP